MLAGIGDLDTKISWGKKNGGEDLWRWDQRRKSDHSGFPATELGMRLKALGLRFIRSGTALLQLTWEVSSLLTALGGEGLGLVGSACWGWELG